MFFASTGVVGRRISAQGFNRYLFSVAVFGPKGHDNIAQGLPWVKFPNRMGLKGPLPYGEDWPAIQTKRISTPRALSGLITFFMRNPG
jgi:hypothetical protein